jgi:acid stress-induced BolA-like protein IbaG/YrbA
MAALTPARLKAILTVALKLREPRFVLEKSGAMVSGSVISESFRDKGDLERLNLIHGALSAALDSGSRRQVGMLLAYTPDEWDMPLEGAPKKQKVKVS